METLTAIQTELGILQGRDCVYLNTLIQDDFGHLTLSGDINGHLIYNNTNEKDWISYQLVFQQVLAYFSCELDTYEMIENNADYQSSFVMVNASRWIEKLPIRKDIDCSLYKHYRFYTYDFVYDILAVDFQMTIDY
ncbi:hypothetical protein [Longibaculum muris]|uniref:hypothetical protein n=1 Tax=Longibaculum muris TaxID=1796628 RepID=UPI0018A0099C|nr:hypothetical protein [Longibaculum muris]